MCDEHKDSTFLTLLTTFEYGGLQVRDERNNWLNVPARPGAMVVNIGVALSNISGGLFKATNHRVVDTGEDRYFSIFSKLDFLSLFMILCHPYIHLTLF